MIIEVELYDTDKVFISHDGSSGCKYTYKDKQELAKIVSDYVLDLDEEDLSDV